MPQSDRNSQRENKSRGNEPNFNWRGIILLAIGFGCIALAMLYFRGGMQPVEDGRPTQTLRGVYVRQGVGAAPAQQVPFKTTVYLSFTNDLQQRLAAAGIQP